MSTIVAVVGKSGFGKTTSAFPNEVTQVKGLDPKETFYFNVKGQPLPLRGWKKHYNVENKNYSEHNSAGAIVNALKSISSDLPHIKNVIIDDSQYIMALKYMAEADRKGYDKFVTYAKEQAAIITTAAKLREDLIVFYMTHSETSEDGDYKIKTVGKMVDNVIVLEGLFQLVLYAGKKTSGSKTTYRFITNNSGMYTAKSPPGMFTDLEIPNDLGLVRDSIVKYYEGE